MTDSTPHRSAEENGAGAAWFRHHLLDELIPRWWEAARTPNGLFRPHLDRQWRVVSDAPVTLVSQTRLIYNFAAAYRHSGTTRYLEAAAQGADALLGFFRAPVSGGWRWSVYLDGTPADEHLSLYGHAFVIFGLSHAACITGDDRYRQAALDTAGYVLRAFKDEHGGFVPALDASGRDLGHTRTQNPIMHLFEGLLALGCRAQQQASYQDAAAVGDWVLNTLVRSDGLLPELYTHDWQELPEAAGGRVDIGHQFEWAYLLSRAVELGVWSGSAADHVLAKGERLLECALRLGYDRAQGGVWSPATPTGRVPSHTKGWWEQCEAARALLHYSRIRQRYDLVPLFRQTIRFCRRRLVDTEYGGWYMRVDPEGTIPSSDKGNVWKVDYHVVGLCEEALRLLDVQN